MAENPKKKDDPEYNPNWIPSPDEAPPPEPKEDEGYRPMLSIGLLAAAIGSLLLAIWCTIYLLGTYEKDDVHIPLQVEYDSQEG